MGIYNIIYKYLRGGIVMTRTDCEVHNKIIQNMGWYLGVDIKIPACSMLNCPPNGCGQRERLLKEIASKLTSESLSDKQRESIRRQHANGDLYSFFDTSEIDELRKDKRIRPDNWLSIIKSSKDDNKAFEKQNDKKE